jgi:hypothetical protein
MVRRAHSLVGLALGALLAAAACSASSGSQAPSAPDGGAPVDAGSELGAPRQSLPLGASDVKRVVVGAESDYGAVVLGRGEHAAQVLVFDRFTSTTEFTSELWSASAPSGDLGFGPASKLALRNAPTVAGGAAVTLGGTEYLYFMAGDAQAGQTRLYRTAFDGSSFGPPQPLVVDDGFTGVYAWPHPAVAARGTIALAFDHYQQAAFVATGDGATFGAPVQTGTGVQSRVAFFADGAIAATYQNGVNGGKMMNYVRVGELSALGAARPITTSNENVHDSFPLTRRDGDVDVYYIAALEHGFSIHRRAVRRDGTFGPEEQITAPEVGSCAQPHPKRFEDGRIALTMACGDPGAGDTDVVAAVLRDDAP